MFCKECLSSALHLTDCLPRHHYYPARQGRKAATPARADLQSTSSSSSPTTTTIRIASGFSGKTFARSTKSRTGAVAQGETDRERGEAESQILVYFESYALRQHKNKKVGSQQLLGKDSLSRIRQSHHPYCPILKLVTKPRLDPPLASDTSSFPLCIQFAAAAADAAAASAIYPFLSSEGRISSARKNGTSSLGCGRPTL